MAVNSGGGAFDAFRHGDTHFSGARVRSALELVAEHDVGVQMTIVQSVDGRENPPNLKAYSRLGWHDGDRAAPPDERRKSPIERDGLRRPTFQERSDGVVLAGMRLVGVGKGPPAPGTDPLGPPEPRGQVRNFSPQHDARTP